MQNAHINLRLFVCNHLADEVEQAARNAELEGVEVNRFEPPCERGLSDWSSLPLSFSSHVPGAPRIVLGGVCLAGLRQTPPIERPATLVDTPQCFELLIGKTMTDALRDRGAHLISPGWLANWRGLLCKSDACTGRIRAELGEARRIVLVDSGLAPQAHDELEALGRETGLPVETLSAGLDHLEALLTNLHLQCRADQSERDSEDALAENQRSLARYAVSIELLGNLAGLRSEEEVIARTMELISMLFAPQSLCYASVRDAKIQQVLWSGAENTLAPDALERFLASRVPHTWESEHRCFLVRIGDGDDPLGILGVAQVAFPKFQNHYLNQTLAMAGVIAMAVRTARQSETMEQAQHEREALTRRVLQSQRLESLRQMAGGIAHHFNNTLQSMIGFCELAQEELAPETAAREWIGDVENQIARAASLTREMLACSGQMSIEKEQIDLEELVENMLPLLDGVRPEAVHIELVPASDLPAVQGDGGQLRQVLSNIVTNACEAMERQEGRVEIRLEAVRLDESAIEARWPHTRPAPGEYVRLGVADEGEGMDEETLERVFDPFFSTRFVGRGLGMAAARGIVAGHGGEIAIESAPGRGTTVSVFLPASEAPQPIAPSQPARRQPLEDLSATILLTDDEDGILKLGDKMLGKMGFDVLTAHDGVEALEVLEREAPNVACVILDVSMPRMGGERCLREIRKRWPELPVVVSTGHYETDVAQRMRALGISGLIHKPYMSPALRTVIHDAIQPGDA